LVKLDEEDRSDLNDLDKGLIIIGWAGHIIPIEGQAARFFRLQIK
jgi:hypothetical protein